MGDNNHIQIYRSRCLLELTLQLPGFFAKTRASERGFKIRTSAFPFLSALTSDLATPQLLNCSLAAEQAIKLYGRKLFGILTRTNISFPGCTVMVFVSLATYCLPYLFTNFV